MQTAIVSGLTGVGGGLLLSLLLLLTGRAEIRQTAGVSVAFILVNAMVALSTNLASMGTLPAPLPIWGVAAVVGGVVGTELGARRLKGRTMRFILAAILALSGLKLILPWPRISQILLEAVSKHCEDGVCNSKMAILDDIMGGT